MKNSLFIALIFPCLYLSSGFQHSIAQDTSLGLIRVTGNSLVTQAGKKMMFRGFSLSDPDKLEKSGHWTRVYFEEAKRWGANILRFPVHPSAWRSRGEENYLQLLDKGIQWATELGIYVIMDWHSIGNLKTELFQNEMYNTTRKETFEFWKKIASHYKGNRTVAFYEIFNEPTTYNNMLGTCSWADWKLIAEEIITIIKANNPEAIPLVAGFNWAYDLTAAASDPINIPGIVYVTHPYPQKRGQPWESQWDKDFGFVADQYPVIASEFGFALPDEKGVHVPVFGDEDYGKRIIDFLEKKGISWMVWSFDPDWAPMMIKDWNFTPTHEGTFFKSILQEKNKTDK